MRTKRVALAGAFAFLVAGALCVAADATVGTWKLNTAKSKYTPAGQAKYDTITIESAGENMNITLDGTDSSGNKVHAVWTGKYDGQDAPVTGSPDIGSLAYRKTDDHHYQSTVKRGGQVMSTAQIVYSADGKTRTVTLSGTNAKGEKISSTAVYDKQ